jgi:hypothetical protein
VKPDPRTARREQREYIERELRDLGRECARVVKLLERLDRYRAAGQNAGDILGELGASVLHLHAHTDGLVDLIDELPDR